MAEGGVVLGRVSLHPYSVAMARPWRCARGVTIAREGWIVSVEDAAGGRGWGECAPLPGAGTESPEAALAALREAAERLPGLAPARALDVLPGLATPAARFGLEGALLDLLARRAGLPLYRFLEPAAEGRIAVNAFAGDLDEGLEARLAEARRNGFEVVKLKLATRPLEEELARLEALADSPQVPGQWRLDVNRGWDLATARRAWLRLVGLPVECVEEPAADADARGLAGLQADAPFAVALDESLGSWPAEEPLPVRRQVLKPMVVGGHGAALALAGRVHTESVVTSSVETAVGLWHAAHLAAAIGRSLGRSLAHGLDTGAWLSDLLGPDLPIMRGRLELGDAPGLGWAPEGLG